MRRNCCRCCKKEKTVIHKVKISEKRTAFKSFSHKIDVREKRIGLVFKIIYVIAVLFMATFMLIAKEAGNGLSAAYIMESCFTAFLFCLLFRMIVYVFHELKCFKINEEDITRSQIDKTEEKYSYIFNYFSVGGITSVCVAIILGLTNKYLNQNIFVCATFIGIVFGSVTNNAPIEKYIRFWQSVSSVMWTIAIASMFAMKGI